MAAIANPPTSTVQSRLRSLSFMLIASTTYTLSVVLSTYAGIPTGGTSTTLSPAQMNSNDPAPSTTVTLYTAMPALGASSNQIRATWAVAPSTGGGSLVNSIIHWDNLGNGEGILILPGTSVLLVASSDVVYNTAAYMCLDFSEV